MVENKKKKKESFPWPIYLGAFAFSIFISSALGLGIFPGILFCLVCFVIPMSL